jgi:hypothetical protein
MQSNFRDRFERCVTKCLLAGFIDIFIMEILIRIFVGKLEFSGKVVENIK